MYRKLFGLTILGLLASVTLVAAEEIDPAIFVIITDTPSYYVGGSGWYAGYVVSGRSGTYDLQIFATGGESNGLWPVTDVHVVVAISEEAASGGLSTLKINGVSTTEWTFGPDPNWPAGPGESVGGPFTEPDYYGYSDTYIVAGGLTLTSGTRDNPKILTVEMSFSVSATGDSKIALLSYGTDAKGQPAKTPFSGGTTFVVPELSTLLLVLAPFAAFGAYRLQRRKTSGQPLK